MGSFVKHVAGYALLLGSVIAAPVAQEVESFIEVAVAKSNSLRVDLGYGIYEGRLQNSTGLNVWKGIRFAAPPTGNLRWKAPQPPATNRTVVSATSFGPNCPQAYPSSPNPPFVPGDEDCLFLNVYAPPTLKSQKLPVLVWIHGGGYGLGDGKQDLSELINDNKKAFIGVTIQYRLGAFGFLSSAEVKAIGSPNAALLDMKFALEWVQTHIAKFGGDKERVTISGESAGGGAVMLLGIAKDGALGTTLFQNGIAASPYLPPQHDFNGEKPTLLYNEFASRAGCGNASNKLDCLRIKDSMTLQQINAEIVTTQVYGTWPFLPVTDGSFIKQRPTSALEKKLVNGRNILVGNNANEGPLFVPKGAINTVEDLKAWLRQVFPSLTDADVHTILEAYASSDAPVDPNAPKFATNGLGPATAVNVSQVATGQQQRANNIYAEATFVCPSYWLNTAYTSKTPSSFHYQYSIPFASHGDDVPGYFGPATPNQGRDFALAFRQIWGNFITKSNPTLVGGPGDIRWPEWTPGEGAYMMNLNTTGGMPYEVETQFGVVTQFKEPGLRKYIMPVNAWTWEGGRGKRCEVWKALADKILI
ncbi:alpha/beta-hydrolase [Westerdykella ornata]|uniref:Carboxylic ester hydrolase n=1 Tax=Westerdykella ornata TaxID=318751 RepID=A0A6A6JXK8_WESOR|nr:alpha/beta-hydrolase [Westerdykella ornata]KAF2280548.1 alpha/beta-hydrolase [Westerdykella ornata]